MFLSKQLIKYQKEGRIKKWALGDICIDLMSFRKLNIHSNPHGPTCEKGFDWVNSPSCAIVEECKRLFLIFRK